MFLLFESVFFLCGQAVDGEGQTPVRLAATVSHVEAWIIAACINKSRILKRRAFHSFVSCKLYENGQVLR